MGKVIYLPANSTSELDRPYPLESGDVLYMQGSTLRANGRVQAIEPKGLRGVTIIGPGYLEWPDWPTENMYCLLNMYDCEDFTIEKLHSRCSDTGTGNNTLSGQTVSCKRITFRDCSWSGSRHSVGFQCDWSEDITFDNNRFFDNWLDGIKLTRENKRIFLNGGSAYNNGIYGSPRGAGIHASARGVSISNFSACGNNGDGIIIKSTKNIGTYGPRTGVSIRGCILNENRDYGVQSAVTNYYEETPFQIGVSVDGCSAEENGIAGFCALGGTMNVSNSLARLNKKFGVHYQSQAEDCVLRDVWLVANKEANLSDRGKDLRVESVMSYAKDVVMAPKGEWDSVAGVCPLSIKTSGTSSIDKYRGVKSIGF